MKATISRLIAGVLLAWALVFPAFCQNSVLPNQREVKYVIFMVPDGMGLADVTATRIAKNGISGPPLWLETLDQIGYERTYSEKNTITDSAASASAWACGEKFVNNEICFHFDGRPHNLSMLELAKRHGWGIGLVATQTIIHATPAAFAAHVPARKCEAEIARQYLEETQPDVLLGGGASKFDGTSTTTGCPAATNLLPTAVQNGYATVFDKTAMSEAALNHFPKLLGLFASGALTPEYLAVMRPPGQPDCLRWRQQH